MSALASRTPALVLFTSPLAPELVDLDRYRDILRRLHPDLRRAEAALMRGRHLLFCAGDISEAPLSVVALVQARAVAAGASLAADALHFDRHHDDDALPVVQAEAPSIVCDNAATLPGRYEGHRLVQRLITSVVLPYLAGHAAFGQHAWMTSSPMPDIARCAQLLAVSPCLGEVADLVDGEMRASAPLGHRSLGDALLASEQFLRASGLVDPATGERICLRGCDHVLGLGKVLRSLRTESELCRAGGIQTSATRYRALLARLPTSCGDGQLGQSHAAAKALSYVLSVIMQCDLYEGGQGSSGGRTADLTTRLHWENGAVRAGGPISFARLQHGFTWPHGQQFVYAPDHAARALQHAEIVQRRRSRAPSASGSVLCFDRDSALPFIRSALRTLSRAAKTPPSTGAASTGSSTIDPRCASTPEGCSGGTTRADPFGASTFDAPQLRS